MTSWSSQPSRPLARRATPIVAAVAAAALIVAGCTADKPKQVTPPNRILQSVAVQMSPNGTTTAIDGTAVSVRDDASDATTQTTEYSPRKVADDLPVRVSTSYRTAKRSGTDLSDLTGYSGRVEIDVTVQNLTIKPEELSYDVAGSSKTQTAMVGAPMTVVASTALPDTPPTDVVTASASEDSATTNGVLSQSEKGGSVVQWAALLAAPQTTSNATLRLVTDAKDFTVPTIDLSVQPGLVTDPSVGGVLDNAFDSNPSSQLALEQRTIKVITDVNQVLTRASSNISSVRKNLKSTSKTLGKHSIEELKTSTKGVASSMKGLDKELKSLNSDISDTLDGTQSSVLSELGQTVSTMDQMLGDTSGGAPTAQVDGSGCRTKVKSPSDSNTVYGNLMQVTAQLDGYASATDQCKEKAQQALVRSVGPEKPSEETCGDTPSTTCSLYYTEQKFSSIMADLVAQGDELVNSLQPEVVDNANNEYDSLSEQVDAAVRAVRNLSEFDPTEDMDSRLKKTDSQLDVVDGKVDALEDHLAEIHDDAVDGKEKATTAQGAAQRQVGELSDDIDGMQDQNKDLGKAICGMRQGGIFEHGLTDSEAKELRSYLIEDADCPSAHAGDDSSDPNDDNSGKGDAKSDDAKKGGGKNDQGKNNNSLLPLAKHRVMNEWLGEVADKQKDAWQDEADAWGDEVDRWDTIADETDVDDHDSKISKDLQKIRDQINLTRSRVKSVRAAVVTSNDKYAKLLGPVQDSVTTLSKNKEVMGDDLKKLSKQQRQLGPTINKAFNKAADDANKNVSKAIDPQIRKVTAQAEVDSEAVGDMFDESAAGLSNAADQINRNGTRTIEQQRQQLEAAAKSANGAAKKRINQSLSQMAKGVSASSRDMNGASSQLTASLKKVLLDLGTRKVKGSGLLGAMTTSAAKVGTADYQLALASDSATSYAGVRSEDIGGILLRQAQLQASLQAGADLPAFHLDVPSGADSQTVYSFEIGPEK